MSSAVLEIGFGCRPACREGELFKNPDVGYIGIELPATFDGSFTWFERVNDFTHITGSMDAMPFKDEAFDYVLMRSVYGQFKSQPSIVTAVRLGIYECMRVLKPNGKMVISEENTPRDMEYIEHELKAAGFIIKAAQYLSKGVWEDIPKDDDYKQARTPYYTSKPEGAYGSYFGTPNIVIGSKPTDIKFNTKMMDVVTNFYEDHDSLESCKIRKLPFTFPIKHNPVTQKA